MNSILKFNKEMYESFAKSAAKNISYFQNDELQTTLTQLRGKVEKVAMMEEKIRCVSEIEQQILVANNTEADSENNEDDHLERYVEQIQQISPDPSHNENLIEFDRVVNALQDANLQGNEANDGDDGELKMTCETVSLIDPVTKRRMTDPVRNTICGHVYDRESVVALLSQNTLTRCPVLGCKFKEYLLMSNMKSDIVTRTQLDKMPA